MGRLLLMYACDVLTNIGPLCGLAHVGCPPDCGDGFVFPGKVSSKKIGKHELTLKNIEKKSKGKHVFIQFFMPWCEHCKAMKSAWNQLVSEYQHNHSIGVLTVDCSDSG